MKQRIEIEVDVPEGWEAVAFRTPRKGECFMSADNCDVLTASYDWAFGFTRVILRRKEPDYIRALRAYSNTRTDEFEPRSKSLAEIDQIAWKAIAEWESSNP